MGKGVAGIVTAVMRIPIAIALAWFTVARVDVVRVGRIVVEADPLDVDLTWVALVVAWIGGSRIVEHQPTPSRRHGYRRMDAMTCGARAIVRELVWGGDAGT
jgi:hypothetical protein